MVMTFSSEALCPRGSKYTNEEALGHEDYTDKGFGGPISSVPSYWVLGPSGG